MEPEFKINHPDFPARNPRIDRLWRKGNTIFEIKPNAEGSTMKGLVQTKDYADWMVRYSELLPGGGVWQIEVITYDQAKMEQFLRGIGKLPRRMK